MKKAKFKIGDFVRWGADSCVIISVTEVKKGKGFDHKYDIKLLSENRTLSGLSVHYVVFDRFLTPDPEMLAKNRDYQLEKLGII